MSSNKNMNHKGTAPQQRYNTNAQFNPNTQGKFKKLFNMNVKWKKLDTATLIAIIMYTHTHTYVWLSCSRRTRVSYVCMGMPKSRYFLILQPILELNLEILWHPDPLVSCENSTLSEHSHKTTLHPLPQKYAKLYTFPNNNLNVNDFLFRLCNSFFFSVSRQISTFLRRIASILDKDVASKKSTHMDGQNNGLFRTLHNHHTRISVWLCVVQCNEAD